MVLDADLLVGRRRCNSCCVLTKLESLSIASLLFSRYFYTILIMKYTAAVLATILGVTAANKPQLSVREGSE